MKNWQAFHTIIEWAFLKSDYFSINGVRIEDPNYFYYLQTSGHLKGLKIENLIIFNRGYYSDDYWAGISNSLVIAVSRDISSIPYEIGELSDLKTLRLLSLNFLSGINIGISNLTNLTTLEIDYADHGFYGIHEDIGNLANLTNLSITNCYHFSSLPESIGNLAKLETLNLRNCVCLESLPDSVNHLTKLTTLDVSGCPDLETPPPKPTPSLAYVPKLELSECDIKLLVEALVFLQNNLKSSTKNSTIGHSETTLDFTNIILNKNVHLQLLKDTLVNFIDPPLPEYCRCGNELTYEGYGIFHSENCDVCLGIERPEPVMKLSEYHRLNTKEKIDWSFIDYKQTLKNVPCAICKTNILTYSNTLTQYCPRCNDNLTNDIPF